MKKKELKLNGYQMYYGTINDWIATGNPETFWKICDR